MVPSTAEHPNVGYGLFDTRILSKGETITVYYGSFVYTGLSEEPQSLKEFDEETLAVSIHTFRQCAIVLPNKASDRLGVGHWCWTVAAPFCATGFLNNAR